LALSFLPDAVGHHWEREVEIDVAAINWTERRLLLGECQWGEDDVGRSVIASLILERGPRLLARLEGEWQAE
jgi:uncharacterized protein